MGKKSSSLCLAAAALNVASSQATAPRTTTTPSGVVVPNNGLAHQLASTVTTTGTDSLWGLAGSIPRGGAKSEEAPAPSSFKKKKPRKRKTKKGNKTDTEKAASSEEPIPSTQQQQQQQTPPVQPETKESTAGTKDHSTAHKEKTEKSGPKATPKEQPKQPSPPKQQKHSEPKTPSTASAIVQEILQHEDYYKILGVDRQVDAAAIQKAYRRRAVQTHPDKTGGDRRAFDKVAEAYDVLGGEDDSKRQLYNRFGKRGLEEGFSAGPASSADLFRSFFGGHPPQQQQPTRNRTTRYQLDVTLEDLYQGMVRTVLVAPPEDRNPFRPQPSSSNRKSSKRVQVQVPMGALHGQAILLSGEMDFDPDETPGDLVFLVQKRPHATFTRKGHDLAVSLPIRLSEAICGMHRTIRHLDGREITLGSARKKDQTPILIHSGDVQVLRGQGMPKNRQGTEFGDLYVQYEVSLPDQDAGALTESERQELGRLLDKLEGVHSSPLPTATETNVQILKPASVAEFGVASGRVEVPPDPTAEDEHHSFASSFGGAGRQFFYSSSSTGSNPFFGMRQGPGYEEDDGSAQCRQM